MPLDITKIFITPANEVEAIKAMGKAQSDLCQAYHIMNQIRLYNEPEDMQIHLRIINTFLKQFET